MSKYRVQVIETRNYYVEYIVEADTLAEAAQRAEVGDTIEEHEVQFSGVTDRFFQDDDIEEITE